MRREKGRLGARAIGHALDRRSGEFAAMLDIARTPLRPRPPEGSDPLYRLRAYQAALRAAELGMADAETLAAAPTTRLVAPQLLRAVGSVTANLAEGYSRGTGPDRARFFEYALGSARECREWYRVSRRVLGDARAQNRLRVLDAAITLIVGTVHDARRRDVRAVTARGPLREPGADPEAGPSHV